MIYINAEALVPLVVEKSQAGRRPFFYNFAAIIGFAFVVVVVVVVVIVVGGGVVFNFLLFW